MKKNSCEKVSQFLGDFVDGLLDPEKTAELKEHLEKCPFCQKLLETYLKTIFILKRLNNVEPPKDMVLRLRQYLLSKLNI